MTITANPGGDGLVFGYISLDSSFFSTDVTRYIGVPDLVNADLQTTSYPPSSGYGWSIRWYLNLITFGLIGNPNKFKSAQPKFDFGNVCIDYRGQMCDDLYWNFSSQRFKTYDCWSVDAGSIFPSPYLPPDETITGPSYAMGYWNTLQTKDYGSGISVKPTNADITTMNAYIYYQAGHDDGLVPVSYGDI